MPQSIPKILGHSSHEVRLPRGKGYQAGSIRLATLARRKACIWLEMSGGRGEAVVRIRGACPKADSFPGLCFWGLD